LVNFPLDKEAFDPFEFGFTFAVGLKDPIDPRIGSLTLNWEKREWIDNKKIATSKNIQLRSCDDASGFKNIRDVSMMCHDEIPMETRNLTGDHYSDTFSYL